jgi:hypothetical protein
MFEATGIALLGAVVGSIFPWTRFGDPSGWFGGWGINPQRWSSLATYAAAAGLLLWILLRARGGDRSLRAGLSLLGLATAAVAGSLLHILRPPPFTHAWLGPWVTLAWSAAAVILSGLLAFAAVASNGAKRSAP